MKHYGETEYPELDTLVYLTGASSAGSRAAQRDDLGLLATPASSVHRQRSSYRYWAADNGCFAETAAKPFNAERWLAWLEACGPESCLFAALPDVVGDPVATLARSLPYAELVRSMGFPVAIVAQDGLEDLAELDVALEVADAIFIGGSTEWKLGAGAASIVGQAREAGLWTHVGRVNSLRRLRHCHAIGADSADGTFLAFGPTVNLPRLERALDTLALETRPAFGRTLELVA